MLRLYIVPLPHRLVFLLLTTLALSISLSRPSPVISLTHLAVSQPQTFPISVPKSEFFWLNAPTMSLMGPWLDLTSIWTFCSKMLLKSTPNWNKLNNCTPWFWNQIPLRWFFRNHKKNPTLKNNPTTPHTHSIQGSSTKWCPRIQTNSGWANIPLNGKPIWWLTVEKKESPSFFILPLPTHTPRFASSFYLDLNSITVVVAFVIFNDLSWHDVTTNNTFHAPLSQPTNQPTNSPQHK